MKLKLINKKQNQEHGIKAAKSSFRQILVGLGFMAVAVVFIAMIVQYSVNSPKYAQQMLDSVKESTGLDASIEGVKFNIFPAPKFSFYGFNIEDISTQYAPKLYVDRIDAEISIMSLFDGVLAPSSVVLVHPIIYVERNEDDINLGWVSTNIVKQLRQKEWKNQQFNFSMIGGEISYKDILSSSSSSLDNINVSGVVGSQLLVRGGVLDDDRMINFQIDNSASDLVMKDAEFPLNFTITPNAKSSFVINTVIDAETEFLNFKGKFKNDIDDMETVFPPDSSANAGLVNQTKNILKKPLKFSGEFAMENGEMKIQNIDIDGLGSRGEGEGDVRFKKLHPTVSLNLQFDTVDYSSWSEFIGDRLPTVQAAVAKTEGGVNNYDFRLENPLPKFLTVSLNIAANKMALGADDWGNANLDVIMDNGVVTVNQCYMDLPDGGILSMFGVVSQGGNGEMRFEGNLDIKGKSLKKAVVMFSPSSSDLPDIGMGEFSATGNLFIANRKIRFSEANITLNGASFSGEFLKTFEGTPKLEAQLKLSNLDLDHVRDTLKNKKYTSWFDYVLTFGWLRNLRTQIDAKIYSDGFKFFDKLGDRATFSVYAYNGDFRLYDLRLRYPDSTTTGSLSLNVKKSKPFMKLIFNGDTLDTHYFKLAEEEPKDDKEDKDKKTETGKLVSVKKDASKTATSKKAENDKKPDEEKLVLGKKKIEKEALYLEWMDFLDGSVDISLKRFINKNLILDNVKFQGDLEGKKLIISSLDFLYSQAKGKVVGTLYGGKIPGISANFTLVNYDLFEFLNALTGITNISGFASISGVLNTSGATYSEWYNNVEGQLLLASKQAKVNGVNIAGVSNVISVARSAADVVNNVKNIVTSGITDFDLDGYLHIANGEMKTPRIALKAGKVTGIFIGGVDLNTKVLQASATFSFYDISSKLHPELILQLSGALDNLKISPDTSALEAFVSKRKIAN